MTRKTADDDESDDQAADLPEESAPEGKQEVAPAEPKAAGGLGGKRAGDATSSGLQGGVHN
jgi:hypothetical protein